MSNVSSLIGMFESRAKIEKQPRASTMGNMSTSTSSQPRTIDFTTNRNTPSVAKPALPLKASKPALSKPPTGSHRMQQDAPSTPPPPARKSSREHGTTFLKVDQFDNNPFMGLFDELFSEEELDDWKATARTQFKIPPSTVLEQELKLPAYGYHDGQSTVSSTTTATTMKVPFEDQFLCVICLEQPKEVVLLPCRHLSTCQQCDVALSKLKCKNKNKTCPICQSFVRQRIRVYL